MEIKILFLLLIIGVISCNNTEKETFNQEKILYLKNETGSDLNLLLVKNSDTLSMLISPDLMFELVGLNDSCNSFEHTLKNKIDYLSYQKGDNRPTVLINKKNNIYLADIDIIRKSKGTFTYSNSGNGTGRFTRAVINYPLE